LPAPGTIFSPIFYEVGKEVLERNWKYKEISDPRKIKKEN
jgi:hypothetical protein